MRLLKTLKYLISYDKKFLKKFFREILLKNPLFYLKNFLKAFFYPVKTQDNFFLFGEKNIQDFKKKLKNPRNTLILGFSYCQKPLICPAERFSKKCLHCNKCQISDFHKKKSLKNVRILVVTTVISLGKELFLTLKKNPKQEIIFIITACNQAINLFAFISKLLNLKGIAIPLQGKTCKTFKDFKLAEEGHKPEITFITQENKILIDDLLKIRENL